MTLEVVNRIDRTRIKKGVRFRGPCDPEEMWEVTGKDVDDGLLYAVQVVGPHAGKSDLFALLPGKTWELEVV